MDSWDGKCVLPSRPYWSGWVQAAVQNCLFGWWIVKVVPDEDGRDYIYATVGGAVGRCRAGDMIPAEYREGSPMITLDMTDVKRSRAKSAAFRRVQDAVARG